MLFFAEQATESETVRKRISREHLSIEYLRAVRIADSHKRCAATDKFAKAVRAHRLTEIMERLHPENSFEYMKRTQYAKDRSGRYPMYYIVR